MYFINHLMKFQMCHLYDWICDWWSCPLLALYAYLSYRMHRWLVNAKLHVSFVYGTSGRSLTCHIWNELTFSYCGPGWWKKNIDIDDEERLDLVRMRALITNMYECFQIRFLEITKVWFDNFFHSTKYYPRVFRSSVLGIFFACIF